MEKPIKNFTDLAFTDKVKEIQEQKGSRDHYDRISQIENNKLTQNETFFIEEQSMFYMSTVGENGWPYIQHRGGPKGFLKVLSPTQIGFADYKGNRQYITTGNLSGNNKAMLFLMDYAQKKRLKIWAEASIVSVDDYHLHSLLIDQSYPAEVERLIVMEIKGFDWNCHQHIDQRFTQKEYGEMLKNGTIQLNKTFLQELLDAQ